MDDQPSTPDTTNNDRKIIKVIPRNLTARAAYLVPGNPATSRPESGVDISFPGLELDQRNLDQRFFPGLYFEFQRDDGVILADVELKSYQLVSGLAREDLLPNRPIFLLGLYARTKVDHESPQFFSFHNMIGREVWPRIHDLLPGRLAIIFGPGWGHALPREPTLFDARLRELDTAYKATEDKEKFVVHRDSNGMLSYAIFSDDRTRYLDDYGVIDLETFAPGELTKTLCAPWIYDFRDCICFYWASNRPDITDGTEPPFLNFLRDRNNPELPTHIYRDWADQRMSHGTLASGSWKVLPIVINDREEQPLLGLDHFARLAAALNEQEIISELKYLATVEHALIVEYLFAYYSLDAPMSLDSTASDNTRIIFEAGRDVLDVAIDEMRHFLWVNHLLSLLDIDEPITTRADIIGLPPEKDPGSGRRTIPGFKYLEKPFALRPLSPEVLKEFIEIEANSRSTSPDSTSFGMYIQLLASINEATTLADRAEHLTGIVKLLIDEGDRHGENFKSIQNRLAKLTVPYLRDLNQGGSDDQSSQELLRLGDDYYHKLLELIHVSFGRGDRASRQLMADAITFMNKLDEVGHILANRKIGLRFTKPQPQKHPVPKTKDAAILMLNESEESIVSQLANVEKSGGDFEKDVAQRHLKASRALYQKFRRTVQEED